jgi:hypothetical protein
MIGISQPYVFVSNETADLYRSDHAPLALSPGDTDNCRVHVQLFSLLTFSLVIERINSQQQEYFKELIVKSFNDG